MSYRVIIEPSGRTFDCAPGETVLAAGLRQDVVLPYGCRDGACGSCKARVLSGAIVHGAHQARALSVDEKAAGWALMCVAQAQSDLTIECNAVAAAGVFPARKMPTRVAAMERVADDVIILRLQLPASENYRYRAGQYLDVLLRDGSRRSYSMASAPGQSKQIELHVRHLPGGLFTDALFGVTQPDVKVRDILRVEGPLGTFYLREDSAAPLVLLASGTGFAPIKAMLEQMILDQSTSPKPPRVIHFYWGARQQRDLYWQEGARAMVAQACAAGLEVRFIPVLSAPAVDDHWSGRTGLVHEAVMADLPDLSDFEVYACGAPVMVDAARRDFIARCGLRAEAFYADAFVSQADHA